MVEASIKESKISGGDRAVAWDGATTGGQELQNQVQLHFSSPDCLSASNCTNIINEALCSDGNCLRDQVLRKFMDPGSFILLLLGLVRWHPVYLSLHTSLHCLKALCTVKGTE